MAASGGSEVSEQSWTAFSYAASHTCHPSLWLGFSWWVNRMLVLECVLCPEFDSGPPSLSLSHDFSPWHHGDCWCVVRSRAHCQGHQGTQSYCLPYRSIFCERSSWQIGTICQGNGLDAAHSFIFPARPALFPGTHLLFCLLVLLWRWEILCFPLEKISFHFLRTVPAAVPPFSVLNVPWKLLPRHFYLATFFWNPSLPSPGRLSPQPWGWAPWL